MRHVVKMNPIEMVKSISLKTKQRKWGVSLFPHGCSSHGGGGDGVCPESWPPARPHLPCASDQDGVCLLSALSLFIIFARSACILSNRALITEYSSTLCCLGLEFLLFPCFMELSYETEIQQMSVMLFLILCGFDTFTLLHDQCIPFYIN